MCLHDSGARLVYNTLLPCQLEIINLGQGHITNALRFQDAGVSPSAYMAYPIPAFPHVCLSVCLTFLPSLITLTRSISKAMQTAAVSGYFFLPFFTD